MGINEKLQDLLGDANQIRFRGTTFGLDFGTTTCLMAYKDSEAAPPRALTYPTDVGSTIPSLFLRADDGREYTCERALKVSREGENTKSLCRSIKTQLHKDTLTLNGKVYETSYIAGQIVKHVMQISQQALENEMVFDKVTRLVCGEPVRFDAGLRGKLKRILESATGVSIVLVPEPVLAAVTRDYYARKRAVQRGETYVPRAMLVVDSGGGTTDIVVLIPNPNRNARSPHPYKTKAPDGLLKAGDEMDRQLHALMLEKIRANPGTIAASSLKFFSDEQHFLCRRLRQVARQFKEELSSELSYADNVSFGNYGATSIRVTRAEYEARIRPLVTEITNLAADVLKRSGLDVRAGFDVLMVGGASHTPLLRSMLRERFEPMGGQICDCFPEKAVALGAAIYAEEPEIAQSKVAFGYAVDSYNSTGTRKILSVVIPSDAELPKTDISHFETLHENQLAAGFRVYEIYNTDSRTQLELEEGEAKEYTLSHKFGRRVPKGTSVHLKTVLTPEGILTMTVTDDLEDSPGPTSKTFAMNETIVK